MKTRGYGALAGIASAAVALGVAELVAVLTGPRTAPLVAVGGAVVDATPAAVKDFAIDVFFTYDKLALLIGTLVLLTLFSAGFGILALRHIGFGYAGIGLFAVIGLAAALTRHEASITAALPTLVGTGVAVGLLTVLLRWTPQSTADERADMRRAFLRLAGGALGGAVLLGYGGRWLAARRGVSADRDALALPAAREVAPPLPAEVDLKLPRLAPFVTPNDDFYLIDTALVVPQVSPETWTLKIHGRVRKPMTITFDDLMRRPMVERYITLACVSNEVGGPLIGNARWLGVPIKDLLDEVEPFDDADQVVSRSVDGFTAGTPTAALRDGRDALLAIGMNGEPLPIAHGFPVRMVVPGLYGYVSATKWLAEWELTSFAEFDAYWIKRGWSAKAPIKTSSRIDTPGNGNAVNAGPVVVAGVAWAQQRGISKVEVRVGEGPWQDAKLAAVPSIDTWRQWSWMWDATPGKHVLTVRATDNGGAVQGEEPVPVAPDGAEGWHSIEVTVR